MERKFEICKGKSLCYVVVMEIEIFNQELYYFCFILLKVRYMFVIVNNSLELLSFGFIFFLQIWKQKTFQVIYEYGITFCYFIGFEIICLNMFFLDYRF